MTMPFTTEAELSAEQSLVGALLRWPERATQADVDPDAFSVAHWREAYRTIRELESARQPISELTVSESLSLRGITVVPLSLLFAASNDVLVGNVAEYSRLVRAGHVRRQLAIAFSELLEGARRNEPSDELLSEALRVIAAQQLEQPCETSLIFDLVKARYRELAAMVDAKGRGEDISTGVATGIAAVDAIIGGLQRGIVTVAAGRPGMGKSAFALSIVRNATARGVGCHVFSLEDTRDAYCDRVISGESGVPVENLRTLAITKDDTWRMRDAMGRITRAVPWLVEDRSGISADEVVRSVRRRIGENKTQLVVIDYVSLLRPPRDVRRGEEAITYSMNVLADAAKQDGISYLVLAQLNRECERRDDKRPMLSDLKQAGTIEERAKAVLFLYRPSVYAEKDPAGRPIDASVVEVLIAKNNQGRTGKVTSSWSGETMVIR